MYNEREDEICREGYTSATMTSMLLGLVNTTLRDGVELVLEPYIDVKQFKAVVETRALAMGIYVQCTLNTNHTILRVRKILNRTMREIFSDKQVKAKHKSHVDMLQSDRYVQLTEDQCREICKESDVNWTVFMRAYRALKDSHLGRL